MALPLPMTMDAILTLKMGEPFNKSKNQLCSSTYCRLVDKLKKIEWAEDGPILLKPTISASQAKFVALAESDKELLVQLSSVWSLAAKRKTGFAQD
ncbi:hypothetical protein GN244_ATG00101 [Phytophthora infestans]|uniref:Uncharacterized protein n=1 Tax=Phytophthora infestans TaxID=4787 RepID=A0A833SET2_PHYIN|nr:hypothetical protein GN244_ATG00101 [Phytophthora infestans]